jgi:hypothetical protein
MRARRPSFLASSRVDSSRVALTLDPKLDPKRAFGGHFETALGSVVVGRSLDECFHAKGEASQLSRGRLESAGNLVE